jgi:hypothetical protein
MAKQNVTNKLQYVIVRCDRSGVHAGKLVSRNGREVTLKDARCIWNWSGAASTYELSVSGAKNPSNCKFTIPVEEIILLDAIAVIPCTPAAEKMIRECKVWTAQ